MESIKLFWIAQIAHRKDIRRLHNLIKKKQFEVFTTEFTRVFSDFGEKLKSLAPSINDTEFKICALYKLGYTDEDLKKFPCLSGKKVLTNRKYWIKKKLKLEREDNLPQFLLLL